MEEQGSGFLGSRGYIMGVTLTQGVSRFRLGRKRSRVKRRDDGFGRRGVTMVLGQRGNSGPKRRLTVGG